MPAFPTGTVTFLFTDIAGSTALWETDPVAMRAALCRHDALVEATVARHHGTLVRPRGEVACGLEHAIPKWVTPEQEMTIWLEHCGKPG